MNPKKKQVVDIKNVKPAYVAQKCPICNGFRTVKWGTLPCEACNQKGYILIPTEQEEKV